jgi:hypothetical protein
MKSRRIFESAVLIAVLLSFDAALRGAEQVDLKQKDNHIDVLIGGKPFTTYYFGTEAPKPYLHPLRTSQGTIITRGWPMVTNIPGESHDHPHHRALFFAHGDINGIDFWGEGTPNARAQTAHGQLYSSEDLPKGRTVFQKLEETKGGRDSGVLRAHFDLVGPDGKGIASEIQEYTFRGGQDTRTIDCVFTLGADRGIPVKLGDTKEGIFAIRVVKALEEPKGKMTNSEGKAGEKAIWGKRANWVEYSGMVGAEPVGIAIFDDPSNIKHPTYWHARGYGLFAVNPFGEHDYYNDPKRDGSVTIPAGGSLTLRYRVLIQRGDASAASLTEAYQRYAKASETGRSSR